MTKQKVTWISYMDLERLTGLNSRDRERLKRNGTIKGKGKMYILESVPPQFFKQKQTA